MSRQLRHVGPGKRELVPKKLFRGGGLGLDVGHECFT